MYTHIDFEKNSFSFIKNPKRAAPKMLDLLTITNSMAHISLFVLSEQILEAI